MIVQLNGLPGVGKLTIARVLEKLLIDQGRDVRLVDNHAVINLCYAVTEHGTPLYAEMIRDLADLLLDYLVKAPAGRIFIFTNALVEAYESDQRRYASIRTLAENRGQPLIPVLLTCADEAEHLRRAGQDERSQRQKLTDLAIVKESRSHAVIHNPAAPHALTLDVATLSPDEAATQIAAHLATMPQ